MDKASPPACVVKADLDELWTARDVVRYLRWSRRTLDSRRASGEFPSAYVMSKKSLRWKKSDIVAYLESLKES